MMDDRTQHVIDAIDGALDDWSVGPDAMRWTPEPLPPNGGLTWRPTYVPPEITINWQPMSRPRRPIDRFSIAPAGTAPGAAQWTDISHLVERAGFAPAPWQVAVLARSFGVAFREAAESLARVCALSVDEIERMAATLAELSQAFDAQDDEPPTPEDPRARALRLRQERNTGPGKTPAGRQKRPRRLPTGARS